MYKNRTEAGVLLARILVHENINDPCILAIPRGGVAVAVPIAKRLNTNIHLLITRKVGHPLQNEVAIGAVMPDGSAVWDTRWTGTLGMNEEECAKLAEAEYLEIQRRLRVYAGTVEPLDVIDKSVIIIDDGIATGYTIRAAVTWLKKQKPDKIIIAVPVAPIETVTELKAEVDDVLCPMQLTHFRAVGMYYEDFTQVTDKEVLDILQSEV
jgi:predicted phosphoribosyltransferase